MTNPIAMALTYPLRIHTGLASEVRREGQPIRIRMRIYKIKILFLFNLFVAVAGIKGVKLSRKSVKTSPSSTRLFSSRRLYSIQSKSAFIREVEPSFGLVGCPSLDT